MCITKIEIFQGTKNPFSILVCDSIHSSLITHDYITFHCNSFFVSPHFFLTICTANQLESIFHILIKKENK